MATGFGTGTPAGITYGADTSRYTLATAFKVTSSGYSLTKIRLYLDSNGGAVTAADVLNGTSLEAAIFPQTDGVYSAGGSMTPQLTTTVLLSSLTMDAWNEFVLDTPYALTAGDVYYAEVYLPAGRYSYISGKFTSDVVAGPITFPADGTNVPGLGVVANGAFATGGSGLQTVSGSFGSTWYGIDIEVTASSGDATISAAVVAESTTVPAPSLNMSAVPTPAQVAGATAMAAPTLIASATVVPTAITRQVAIPAATVSLPRTVAPAVVSGVTAAPAPTVNTTSTATVPATSVASAVGVPAPTVTAQENVSVSAPAVHGAATVLASTQIATANVAPASVSGTAQVPAPAVSSQANATILARTVAAVTRILLPVFAFRDVDYGVKDLGQNYATVPASWRMAVRGS